MKKLHLICNAHIDPIWQWTWDEGISATISTFKAAADLADEFDYIFCHNEALLYEAIEQNAPDLFARIQRLVKEGKWKITGGWYLQPDCLMPAGETFVRHIAVGREYFKEKFDTTPTVATNFDSFGHSVGLVQILAKCGYDSYLICRPNTSQFIYPSRFFTWRGKDGSSVTVSQSASYNCLLGKATEKIKTYAAGIGVGMLGAEGVDTVENQDVDYVLWGVGNHGGGPSRKDLTDIKNLKIDGFEILHSTPEALFSDEINVGGEVSTSLITCMPGCYTSMARIKQGYRRSENLFYATEKMIASATLAGLKIDTDELRRAEKRMLLTTFHDTLPGTLVEPAEREMLATIGSVERTLFDYRTRAFLYLTMNERCAEEGEYPVFVYNYMPYELTTPVEVDFSLADQNWSETHHFTPHVYDENGRELPSQTVKEESTLNLDWRKKVVFEAPLKPLGITRFSICTTADPIVEKKAIPLSSVEDGIKDESLLCAPAAFDLYDDTADPWGMSAAELLAVGKNPTALRLMTPDECASFLGNKTEIQPVRITENGSVYTAVEAIYTSGRTSTAIEYKLYKNEPYFDIKATVEFADKNKLLRLRIPVPQDMRDATTFGDGPFVCEEKPSTEISFQKWLGVKNEDGDIFAVINDCIYGGKVEDGYIHLSLVRGAGYCFHPIYDRQLYPEDRYMPRIDSGRYVYNFRIMRGTVSEIQREAEQFNQRPYAVNVFPTGAGDAKVVDSPIDVSGDIVTVTVKNRHTGGYVMRFYNPAGQTAEFTVRVLGDSVKLTASAAEVVSVVYENGKFSVLHDEMPV